MSLATVDEEEVLDGDSEGGDEGDFEDQDFDPSRLIHQKGLNPVAREILARMYGVPLEETEKEETNRLKVINEKTQAVDETKETTRLNPCSADYADDYLRARQYETQEGLRLRNHRGQWLRFDGAYYEPLRDKELRLT